MLVIDRFEADYAVVETGKGFVNIPRADLPAAAREGDVLVIGLDKKGTDARDARIEGLASELFKD